MGGVLFCVSHPGVLGTFLLLPAAAANYRSNTRNVGGYLGKDFGPDITLLAVNLRAMPRPETANCQLGDAV